MCLLAQSGGGGFQLLMSYFTSACFMLVFRVNRVRRGTCNFHPEVGLKEILKVSFWEIHDV